MKKAERELYEAAFAEVGREVFELLGPTEEMLALERRVLGRRFKKPSFTSEAPVVGLAMGAAAHVAHGDFAAVRDAALLLRVFPFTGDYTLHYGPNIVQYLAVMVLSRAGDVETADELSPYLFNDKHGGEPGPPVINDALDHARRGRSLRYPWRGVPETHLFDAGQTLSWTYTEIGKLAKMWCLNPGVTEWSREEIEAEIDRNIAFIEVLDDLGRGERPPYLGPVPDRA